MPLRRIILLTIAVIMLSIILLPRLLKHFDSKEKFIRSNHEIQAAPLPPTPPPVLPTERIGETVSYMVKMGAMNMGTAVFTRLPDSTYNGKAINVMTFETKLQNFSDLEIIYSDPETYLPVRVERKLSGLFGKEDIVEEYDQTKFCVTLTKTKGSKVTTQTIQKNGLIHNAILFPFSVRRTKNLIVNQTFSANFPSRTLTVKLESTQTIKVPAGTFQTYVFKSTPRQISIWLSNDEKKIPLKIEGSGLLGYTMLMTNYSVPPTP